MTTVTEWLARRDRRRALRAQMAAARTAGKQRRHQQRLDQARTAENHGAGTESPGEGKETHHNGPTTR